MEISGKSLANLWKIFGKSLENLWKISSEYHANFNQFSGISQAFLRHISGISQTCRRHISSISQAYLIHILGKCQIYLISGIYPAYIIHIKVRSHGNLTQISGKSDQIWTPAGLHKTGMSGIQDNRQIVDGKTNDIENNDKKGVSRFLNIRQLMKKTI